MKQPPPLTVTFRDYKSTTVDQRAPSYSEDIFAAYHFYLNPNSSLTTEACRSSSCTPYFIVIVKGQKDMTTWLNSPHDVNNPVERKYVIETPCSVGQQQLDAYTTTKADNYYLFYYITSYCNAEFELTTGSLSLSIVRSEYSVAGVKTDGVCSAYKFPSCTLSVPLQTGYEKALVTIGGYGNNTYAITFRSSNRKWAYFIVVALSFLPFSIVIVVIICSACINRYRLKYYNVV